MKKRRTIYVTDEDWRRIRIAALGLGVSVGDYFVDIDKSYGDEFLGLGGMNPNEFINGVESVKKQNNPPEVSEKEPKKTLSQTNSLAPEGEDTELDAAMGNASWQKPLKPMPKGGKE